MSKFKNVHPLDWTLVAGGETLEPLYVIESEGAIARTREAWFQRGFILMSEEDAENRMNIIGQNGNVGYPEPCEVLERPDRYSSREVNGMDVIDLVKHWDLNFNEGNILKYLLRNKGEDVQDLEKIIDYAQRELKHKLKK